MANRDLGLDKVACAEAAAATEPPHLPSTPNREQEAQCHTCQSHEDVFDIPDVTSYSAAGN